jgi:xylanolytic transcriptional activator XlnR
MSPAQGPRLSTTCTILPRLSLLNETPTAGVEFTVCQPLLALLAQLLMILSGGLRAEQEIPHPHLRNPITAPTTTAANEPAGLIDDVLTFILLSIAVSGGDFKSDCVKWWSKATRLALSLRLNREDERCLATVSPCANPLCSCRREQQDLSLGSIEHREERRLVFWLLYSLDRHLSLSFNSALSIPDSYCEVFSRLIMIQE